MNISTGVKIVLSGAVASFALLTLTPTASFANTSREVVTPNQSVRAINEAKLIQVLTSQRTTPTNRMPQQPEQTGCKCCQAMMNHKPGMTNNQDSPSK
ncbi:hypothetical protein H6G10_13955 [Anabaena cylindrica FACHB-170]|uniref:Secreted protein n=2 Tax=Nostocaceae TaxID=1162 RepID=A0A1Z4KVM4_ANAVA|nr:hypothetical protein [Anabaena cylindrica FACHB-318]MBD2284290.1 hypothetical protein [Anabaena cylindrica FACHB-170]BAY73075.1 hypothetical protein NIES23_59030 [Trichormus variabilis NIES-23]HBW31243.1 hypothetical protein [Nostoc sp. UBA8866]